MKKSLLLLALLTTFVGCGSDGSSSPVVEPVVEEVDPRAETYIVDGSEVGWDEGVEFSCTAEAPYVVYKCVADGVECHVHAETGRSICMEIFDPTLED